MNFKTFQVCVFLSLMCTLNAFSIISVEVLGDGRYEDKPAKEGTFISKNFVPNNIRSE